MRAQQHHPRIRRRHTSPAHGAGAGAFISAKAQHGRHRQGRPRLPANQPHQHLPKRQLRQFGTQHLRRAAKQHHQTQILHHPDAHRKQRHPSQHPRMAHPLQRIRQVPQETLAMHHPAPLLNTGWQCAQHSVRQRRAIKNDAATHQQNDHHDNHRRHAQRKARRLTQRQTNQAHHNQRQRHNIEPQPDRHG